MTLAPGSRFESSISPGWRFSTGSDIRLQHNPDGSETYYGPNGQTGTFLPDGNGGFTSPSTIKATLGSSGLTDHASGDAMTFNTFGSLSTITDRNGNVTKFHYNSVGGLTEVITDKGTDGARTVDVTPGGISGMQIDQLSQTQDATDSRTVTYSYDAQGRLSKITDVLNRDTEFGYSNAGDLTSISAPGGAETDFTYDANHRVTSVTQPSAGTAQAVTRFVYNAGQTWEADPNTDQNQAVSAVPHTTYDLDGSGLLRVATATDPAGHQRSASYTTFSDLLTAQDSAGTTTFENDGNNGESLTQVDAPTTGTFGFAYGNSGASQFFPSSSTDAQQNTTNYTYDGAGNMLQAQNGSTGPTAKVTYNADGTVATSVTPADATTTYGYVKDGQGNSTGQVASITPPSGDSLQQRSYTYDTFGRIATYTSGRGITQTFTYDPADRVKQVEYSDGTPSVSYTYNNAGQVATRSDASGTTTYTYDPLGRLASRVHTAGGGLLSYAYDLDGNLVSETDGNGTTTDTYNTLNQLTSTVTPDGKTMAFDYDNDGKRTDTWFNTNSAHTTWSAHTHTTYDASHRVTEVWTARASNDATKLSDLTYSYASPGASSCPGIASSAGTDTGLRWSQTDKITGLTTSYCYDSQNQLTSVTTPGGDSWTYTYDTDGNRTQVTENGATVQNFQPFTPGNQINPTDGYTYDGAGNLTDAPGAVHLTYNGSDQMTGRSGGANGNYTYAGSTQTELISQTVPGGGTYTYTYGRTDQNGLPILDTLSNSNGTSYLIHDNSGTPLAFKTYNGSTSFFVLDGLGSPVALVNTSGTVIATYTYDPWGNVTVGNPTNSVAAGLNPYRFAGGMLDRTTNYVKYGQRYYDPSTGRFTQQDNVEVIGDPGRGNRYAYAGDNPINNIDPTGRSTTCYLGGPEAFCTTTESDLGVAASQTPFGTLTGCEVAVAGGVLIGIGTFAFFGGAALGLFGAVAGAAEAEALGNGIIVGSTFVPAAGSLLVTGGAPLC